MPIASMLARLARELPRGDCLHAPRRGGFRGIWDVRELWSRHENPLGRSIPELLVFTQADVLRRPERLGDLFPPGA